MTGMRVSREHVTHPDQAFRFLDLTLPVFGGPRHRHAALELTWVERGAGLRFVGDSAEPFEDGDLVLLGPQIPHLWSAPPAPDGTPLRATVLQFPAALLEQALLPELLALRPLAHRAQRGLQVGGAARQTVTAHLRAMRSADPLGRLAGLVAVLGELARRPEDLRTLSARAPGAAAAGSTGPAAQRQDGPPARIDRVLDWIHAHLAEPLTLAEAARVAHVSPAAFSRFFRRETGKTYTDYVNDVRCSEACVRLRGSTWPVAAVAQACGFATASHFNRQFRARLGMTPRAYRSG
jgi:AraC-like DNA-binding protein